MALDAERQKLFRQVRVRLGSDIRGVELKDDTLCDLLEQAVGDYAELVQNFVIESNWSNFYGKKVSNIDLAYALSVRTFDASKDYSDWFSKQVGLSQHGTKWELKKDFFKIEKGKQVYMIPAGREINKVLWITPPTTDAAIGSMIGGLGINAGSGVFAQTGLGAATMFGGSGSPYGMGVGFWALPFADIATMATDLSYKAQFLRSDLAYKVTAGPNGTHLIHLMSVPGSKRTLWGWGIENCVCWYTYYDVESDEDADACRKENPDVLLTPDQVPLAEIDYSLLNSPTKQTVRRLLTAMAAETLAFIRGKFSGQLMMVAANVQMDYAQLMTFGNEERKLVMQELKERLERLTPYSMMEKQAKMVEDIKTIKKGTPLGIMVR